MPRITCKKTDYMNQVFGLQDKPLSDLIRTAKADGVGFMQVDPYEGRILSVLTRMIQARKAVEIGTLYGFSAFHIARALQPDGILYTCDKDGTRQKRAEDLLKETKECKKIHWICGPAQKTLKPLSKEGPFDLVFIDGDKQAYGEYLDWAEKNLRSGGLLIADNTFLFGAVFGEETQAVPLQTRQAMERFNQTLSRSKQWDGALIPTDEGLTVAVKR